jgi:serine/threonine-protein kinase
MLFTGGSVGAPNVQALSLASGRTTVIAVGYRGRYLPTGHVVYVHKKTLFAFACDPSTLKPRGAPVPLLSDVADDATDRAAHFDCAENGTLVYSSGEAAALRVIACMDRAGR